jgi:hypothetical protein
MLTSRRIVRESRRDEKISERDTVKDGVVS